MKKCVHGHRDSGLSPQPSAYFNHVMSITASDCSQSVRKEGRVGEKIKREREGPEVSPKGYTTEELVVCFSMVEVASFYSQG